MEEVPDRVADGVDHPETIILGDKVFVSHNGGSFRERLYTDEAVFVRDVSCRHRISVAVTKREEFASCLSIIYRVLPLRLR